MKVGWGVVIGVATEMLVEIFPVAFGQQMKNREGRNSGMAGPRWFAAQRCREQIPIDLPRC